MQSVILTFFANLFHRLADWFNESLAGRAFNRVSAMLAKAFRNSATGHLFANVKTGTFFKESLFYKLLTLPIVFCRFIARRVDAPVRAVTKSSGVLWLFENWHSISIRAYGTVLFAFSVCYGLLRGIFAAPSLLEWIFILAVFFLSLLSILINRSLKSLFKGSRILTAIGGLFGYVNTKETDSKLFLKDPEFLFTHPLWCIFTGLVTGAVAYLVSLPCLLLAVVGCFYVCLVLRYPIVGVFTVIMAAPVLPTMALAACCCLVVLAFFLHLATQKDFILRPVPMAGYIAVFALTLLLGTLNSFTFMKSMQILFIHLAFILFYFVAFQTLDSVKKWRGALVCFLMMAGLVALYGIYQNFAGISSTDSWVDQEMFQQIKTRVYSTFDNPNVLGEYLVLIIPITFAVIWRNKTYGQKTLYTALLLCLGACLIFTWSRGAWLGVILGVAAFLLIMDKRWSLLAVLGIFMLPMLLGSNSAIANRILSIGNTADTSTAYRVSIWQASVNMLRDFWLSGIGPGSDAFTMIYPKYAFAGANYALHAHNLFLQLWVEIGICGIVSFLALIVASLRQAFSLSVYQQRNQLQNAVVMALAAGLLGFLFQGLTDNVWYNYKMILIFWIVMAFLGSAASPDFNPDEANTGGDLS